jgi:hypothetical protein
VWIRGEICDTLYYTLQFQHASRFAWSLQIPPRLLVWGGRDAHLGVVRALEEHGTAEHAREEVSHRWVWLGRMCCLVNDIAQRRVSSASVPALSSIVSQWASY